MIITKRLAPMLGIAAMFVACNGNDSESAPEPNPTPSDTISQNEGPEPADSIVINSTEAFKFLQSAKIGWNLGNQLDAHANGVADETCWGNPKITQGLIDLVAKSGFGMVRIPVTWLGHVTRNADATYEIEKEWLDRVEEVVGYVQNAGMKAIINIHHDGYQSDYWLDIKTAAIDDRVNGNIEAQLKDMWTQIANRFKDYSTDFLAFESMNEIHDGEWGYGANRTDGGAQYARLNRWQQVFVDAVRATGGNNAERFLGICGYSTNPDLTIEHLELPNDSAEGRLMVAVHSYDPSNYALALDENKKTQWGHTGTDVDSPNDEDNIKELYNKLKTAFVDKGIPVYMGEYGAVNHTGEEDFRRYYMEYVTRTAYECGILPIYWDNGADTEGETFGLFDRNALQPFDFAGPIIEAMMRAAGVTETEEGYSLETIYNSAPRP